jgi:signal transduction histidine kinase
MHLYFIPMLKLNIDLYISGFISITVLMVLICILWITLNEILKIKKAQFADYKLRELHSIENVREQISNDLHDAGASLLTQFQLKIRSIENNLSDENKSKVKLKELLQNLNEFSTILRNTIEDVYPKELIMGHWTQAIEQLALRYQTESLVIIFHNEISFDDHLQMIQANQCFRIVQELLSNIIKYECPTKMVIETYRDDNNIVIVLDSIHCKFFNESVDSISGGRGNIHFMRRLKLLNARIKSTKFKEEQSSIYTLTFKGYENTGS